jgi:hypothetical protein
MRRIGLALCIATALLTDAFGQEAQRSAIGMPVRREQLVLPGSELEVVPGDRKDPVVLRIVASYPHGTSYRYDLEYYGLDPGTFDLRKYLRRKDGSSSADLPSLPVTFEARLSADRFAPNDLPNRHLPWLGGYRLLLGLAGGVWIAGLAAILFWGRRRKAAGATADARPLTLAERLRPLVQKARTGELTLGQRAELERTLLAYWRTRLNLGELKPTEAFAQLRRHPDAGPLLAALESWLHRPGSAQDIDLAELLAPYQHLPAEAEAAAPLAGRAT